VRFVHDKGLSQRNPLRVKVANGELELHAHADGRVTVDMGPPVFALDRVPFNAQGLQAEPMGNFERWPLALPYAGDVPVAVLSMGNPHAVMLVDDVKTAPVQAWGPMVERHERFPQRVNAGFLQVISRTEVKLRVFERGTGETLACGTGACAAVVAGIRLGLLDARVDVHTHGGALTIEWQDNRRHDNAVFLTGPATTVFDGEITIPDIG
jgi:diaminopimelate epimerase